MDPLTLALVASGSLLQMFGRHREGRRQDRRWNEISQLTRQNMLGGPTEAEQMMANFAQRFNTGQDSIMQSLRADPLRRSASASLSDLAATGNPFDTSPLFEALTPIRDRQRRSALADLRAGAPGLGTRFGSAMMRGEQELTRQLLEDQNALDAQIQMQAHEAAQGRRLSATDQIRQLLFGEGQLGLSERGLGLDAMRMLAQAQLGRQQGNTNLLSVLASRPVTQSAFTSLGNLGMDFGQLLMLRALLG